MTKKHKPLERAHGLCCRLHVSEDDVCLTAHLHRPQRHDVEHSAVGGEKEVERRPQVVLFYLGRRQVVNVEAVLLARL
jgi:hypothetical protein